MTRQPDALAALLAEEHAAIHLYGVLGPRLPEGLREYARLAYDDHRRHRDLLVELVRQAGATPAPPLLSYAVPQGDPRAVAEAIEDSLAIRWHAAVRLDAAARQGAAAALADEAAHLATLRYARRRNAADAVSAFPGR
ncbi:MAG TPA: DUF4439 domain-containing protein [Frankiaceae bacterium]|jgi:hypothetical protein|nr:DUF4439 domain-containing protein [Frankiaceae bacterium]